VSDLVAAAVTREVDMRVVTCDGCGSHSCGSGVFIEKTLTLQRTAIPQYLFTEKVRLKFTAYVENVAE
jgi:hypothetical protein